MEQNFHVIVPSGPTGYRQEIPVTTQLSQLFDQISLSDEVAKLMVQVVSSGPGVDSRRYRALVEFSPDLILILSAEGVIMYAGPSAMLVLGTDQELLAGHRLEAFLHPEDLEVAQGLLADLVDHPFGQVRQVLRMQAADGRWLHIDNVASNRLADPGIGGILLIGRDMTDRIAVEKKLSFAALHDPLTGLANRALFQDRTNRALSKMNGESGSVAVVLLDLNRFKGINDTLGHQAGDKLLTVVAARLRGATRGSDTVARLGGDEFAVLLTGLRGRDDVLPVITRVETMVQYPVCIDGHDLAISASIGVAIAAPGSEAIELLRQADVAMYAAKESGSQSLFFEPEMQTAVDQRVQLEVALRHAIENERLTIAYQPLVELGTGAVYGVEALLRWRHPEEGSISPDRFIPVAEETGLIIPLGRWILQQACATVSGWQKTFSREPPLLVSVNISARQLVDERIVNHVAEALSESGLAPGSLVLELTESALLEQTAMVMQRLTELKELGVRLAIDDFGTGYSSLAYLRSFPIDILKIDRRFVFDLDRGGGTSALAKAVLSLGNSLNLRTVAEGVETESQLAELRAMGCQYGQGFHFTRPLEAAELEQYLRDA